MANPPVLIKDQSTFDRIAAAVRAYERTPIAVEGGGTFGRVARGAPVAIGITRTAVGLGGWVIVDLYAVTTPGEDPVETSRNVEALLWTGLGEDELLDSGSKVFLVRVGAGWVLSEWNCDDIIGA